MGDNLGHKGLVFLLGVLFIEDAVLLALKPNTTEKIIAIVMAV